MARCPDQHGEPLERVFASAKGDELDRRAEEVRQEAHYTMIRWFAEDTASEIPHFVTWLGNSMLLK